jgi:hypothetical protein
MRFDSVKKLKGEAFRRLTGVQRSMGEALSSKLWEGSSKLWEGLPRSIRTALL